MNTKWKIISLVMFLITSVCIIFASLLIDENHKNTQLSIDLDVANVQGTIKSLSESRYQVYRDRVKTFVDYETSTLGKSMVRAFAERDQDALQKISTPFLKMLQKENPYLSTLCWITPDNRNFLRTHSPDDALNEDVSHIRPDIVSANYNRGAVSGYIVGRHGLQYRVIQPVVYDGQFVGLIQFGIDVKLYLDVVRDQLDSPVGLVIPKDRAELIVISQVATIDAQTHIVQSLTMAFFDQANGSINWDLQRQQIRVGPQDYILVNVFDFLDYQGGTQASLFVALDISKQNSRLESQLIIVFTVSLAVLFLSFALLYSSYGALIGQVLELNNKLKKYNHKLEETVSKRARSLKQSQERFKKLSSLSFEGILLHDQGIALDMNESLPNMLGYDRNELLGRNMLELAMVDEYHSLIKNKINEESPAPYEVMGRRKDGSLFPAEIVSRQVVDDTGSYRVSAIRDISKRKKVELALGNSEKRYQLLSDSTFEAIFLSEKGVCVDQNKSAEKMFGFCRDEAIGKDGTEWVVPECRDRVRENILNDVDAPYQVAALRKDGSTFPCEIQAKVTRIEGKKVRITALRDITEQHQAAREQANLEHQLRQKFKMEAVGLMAGGISHNFNNSLAIVLSSLEMAQRRFSQPEKVKAYIDNARIAVLRSRDLVKQIMTYSRSDVHETASVKLPLIVDETLNLLRSTNPSTIQLNYSLAAHAGHMTINADPGRIQEVLLNLYTNAMHAMNESGTINIVLDQVTLDQRDIPAQYRCQSGPYARLRIQDDGCGMEPEVLEKIFDPFYTTKKTNEGTGMGLSTVQGIVDQHGGLIKVESLVGNGSTFDLYFPVTEESQSPRRDEGELPPQGNETILLVDDEVMIIELAEQILGELGYEVTSTNSGREALAMVTNEPERFDLVITDQTMPEITGQQLAQKIKTVNPDLPVILCTGYSSKISADEIDQYNIAAYCRKPLGLVEFSQVIRSVLDSCA
jgi:PAS domain S-box-containing protein